MNGGPVPALSRLFGYGAMVPLIGATLAGCMLPARLSAPAIYLALVWAGAILAFLAGVRRGLSFRTPGGPTVRQLVGMLWLFALAFAALAAPWQLLSCALLLAGYASVVVLDRTAAQTGEAPAFFANLRPPQMILGVVSLLAVGVRLMTRAMP